ncbi:hypothetical protein [Streptomyces sp. NPDC006610]|uniref:hypothetical protein n=1 Tax=Streptomyces sp. NPDC006610 TaxID=3154584 RepID=UPI0033B98B66
MTAMLRGLVHVLAWSLATGAATTLSWWGVHTVMAGTAYDPPRALPVAAGAASPEPRATSASTRRPAPSTSPAPGGKPSPEPSGAPAAGADRDPGPDSDSGRTATAGPDSAATASPTAGGSASADGPGEVRSYATDGGRVVFDLGRTSATLVSASPGPGWSMQVWKTQTWIRVEFSAGADRVSVFCTWHDGPPRVEIGTY